MKFTLVTASTLGMTLLTGCSGLQVLNATSPSRGNVRTKDVAFGDQPRQKLDVYRPKKAAPGAKVIIFFYGGSWRSGHKADYRFVADALTSRGFMVVLPDYRLYPEVIFPAFVEDGAASVRWVHDHIAKFGGDPNQLYLMGHSAGAHLAAMLTLDARFLKAVGLDRNAIRATAGLSGPYDFVPTESNRAVFGLRPDDATQTIQPIHYVDGQAPPMLLLQGLKDKTVEPGNAFRLAARIREAGGKVDCRAYPDRAHASVVVALAWPFRWLAPVLDDVTRYFNQH